MPPHTVNTLAHARNKTNTRTDFSLSCFVCCTPTSLNPPQSVCLWSPSQHERSGENTWKYQVVHREVEFITSGLTDPPCTAQVVVCFKFKYQRLSSHIILNFLHKPRGNIARGTLRWPPPFVWHQCTSTDLHWQWVMNTHKRRAGAERRSHIISVPVIFHKSARCASLKRHEREELRASAWQKKKKKKKC